MSSNLSAIGVYGMGVMGANLAMNIASKGFKVSISNRSLPRLEAAVKQATDENVCIIYFIILCTWSIFIILFQVILIYTFFYFI